MATRQLAQGLAGLGRYGDSMLMHVSPDEVAGIQHLGKLHGASLTTNPHTGLPEAFSFGNFFKTMAPTIAGVIAAPMTAGTSMALLGPIMAGAATGAGIAGASGDNMLTGGLMGGLGGYGGAGIGNALGTAGGAAGNTTGAAINAGQTTAAPAFAPTATAAGSTMPSYSVAPLNTAGAGVNLQSAMPGGSEFGLGSSFGGPEISNVGALDTARASSSLVPPVNPMQSMAQGLKNPSGFVDAMGGPGKAAMGVGLPLGASYLAGNMPEAPEDPHPDKYDPNAKLNLNYDTGLRLAGGGLTSLYGNQDGTQAQNTLNENYGLGRLNNLSSASSMEQAKFNSNGYSAPAQQPYGGAQYNPQPMGQSTQNQPPMGQPQQPQMGQVQQMGGFGGFNSMGPQNAFTPQPKFAGGGGVLGKLWTILQDPNFDAYRTRNDGYAEGGLADGGFVVPADVVSHLGNGSTDAGLKHLHKSMGAKPIRGAGDGMSDSIKTTIDGKQPARIADGEAYIPPHAVKQRGGAKNLYNMMNKVRKDRTGTTKQGKQINPSKYMP